MEKMVNYYAELGLDRGLDIESLKQELTKLRRKWQNRANSATKTEDQHKAEDMMQLIRDASAILLNENEKKKYDKKLDKNPELFSQQSAQEEKSHTSTASNLLDDAAALDALEAAYDQSQYNSAIAIANKLIEAGNTDIRVYWIAAMCYIETGRENQAIMAIQNMIKAYPDNIEARYWAAFFDLRVLNGRVRESRKHIDWLLQSEEGASARVAALDVEYYIDVNDFALAEAKTEEYKKTVGNDLAFKKSVSQAYNQHANSFYSEYGGDVYFEKKSDFENWKKYHQIALSIYPDTTEQRRFNNNLKIVSGITFEKANFTGIVFSFLLAALMYGGYEFNIIAFGFVLIGIYIAVFSFVPKWLAHKASYTGKMEGPYLVAEWASKAISVVFNAVVWLIKALLNIIFTLISIACS